MVGVAGRVTYRECLFFVRGGRREVLLFFFLGVYSDFLFCLGFRVEGWSLE